MSTKDGRVLLSCSAEEWQALRGLVSNPQQAHLVNLAAWNTLWQKVEKIEAARLAKETT